MHANVKRVNADISSDICPKIVEFENGNLSSLAGIAKRIRFDIQKPRSKDGNERILTADSGNMKYIGHRKDFQCRYYVGVLDTENGNMEVYNSEMFHMQPTIIDENNKKSQSKSSETEKTYLEKSDQLVEAFGSAKQKRAVSARKKNVVDKVETNTKILQVAEKINLNQNSLEPESPSSSIIPPVNNLATTPEQFYNLKDIIPPSLEPIILENAKEVMGASLSDIETWKDEKRFPEYILQHLSSLPGSKDARKSIVIKLCYLSYMMQFFHLTYADLRKKDVLPDVPAQIKSRLFSEFSLENDKKRFIPKRLKDKTLCHILVLTLLIDEFNLDCSTIMRDLKLGPARISMHLKAIGCHIESRRKKETLTETGSAQKSGTSIIARLKLPLPMDFLNKNRTP